MRPFLTILLATLSLWLSAAPATAHHVLGRPSYSLNEDSNTPPSMQVEVQLGDLFVTTMVYPAGAGLNRGGLRVRSPADGL